MVQHSMSIKKCFLVFAIIQCQRNVPDLVLTRNPSSGGAFVTGLPPSLPSSLPPSRLLPYGCLSTGNRVGFIEIVRKSNTIANIQKEKSSRPKLGLWDSNVLYAWLKEKNPTEPQ